MRKSGIKSKKTENILYYPKKGYKNVIRILKLLSKEEMLSTKQIGTSLSKSGDFSGKQIKDKMEYLAELGYCSEYRTVTNSEHMCENCNKCSRYLVGADILESGIETMKGWRKTQQKEGHVIGRLLWRNCFNCGNTIDSHKEEYYKIQHDRYWTLSYNGRVVMLGILTGEKLYNFIERQTNIIEFDLINSLIRSNRKDLVDRLIGIIKKNMDVDSNVLKHLKSWYDEIKTIIHTMKVDKKRYPDLANFKEKYYFDLQADYGNKLNKKVRFG